MQKIKETTDSKRSEQGLIVIDPLSLDPLLFAEIRAIVNFYGSHCSCGNSGQFSAISELTSWHLTYSDIALLVPQWCLGKSCNQGEGQDLVSLC